MRNHLNGGAKGMKSSIRVNGSTVIKTYIELQPKYSINRINSIANVITHITPLTEYEAHKRLSQRFPNNFPQIISYKEVPFTSVPKDQQTHVEKWRFKTHGPEKFNQCTLTMSLITSPNVEDELTNLFTAQTPNITIDFLTEFFKLTFDVIKLAHIVPHDRHTGNIHYNPNTKHITFIDCGDFESVEPVTVITSHDVGNVYHINPPETNQIHNKRTKAILTPTHTTTPLTTELAESLLLNQLATDQLRGIRRELIQTIYIIHGANFVNILKAAISSANLSQTFQKQFISIILAPYVQAASGTPRSLFIDIQRSVMNWLGGPFFPSCLTRHVLEFMNAQPDRFKQLYDRYTDERAFNQFKSLSKQNLMPYLEARVSDTLTRQLITMLYLGYDPYRERENLTHFVTLNMRTVPQLWKAETRSQPITQTVGQSITFKPFTSATSSQSYALTCLSDSKNQFKYVFKFIDVQAAHITRLVNNYTTHVFKYNPNDLDDKNPLMSTYIDAIAIGDEYILNPRYTVYTITNIQPQSSCVVITLAISKR